ncbi:geranylgeranylglycerol-phosphate geranylgeranyltransferase [Oceanihabitans sediminis]|uniref:geranylgeranylglycerol-phosphate geranylgeranyltransferase n=1 Tax=Oceanihabitans sediminis TaxID=1812012 RepID=UPI000930EEBF|nr:geranylgeranylglycerol-phosphate geranylgeranyltransferase [Oceanihabitans sediminis]MDX1278836.1 geranylgeranylglycerol-phosphate geranylgeranyltransferase [Oceanihabitans sediminis]MDX1773307.1 geranylgeranylglycerol-phosphate geranylgeranyltransferase [Oceanihabitans sediminis]
MYSFLNLIRWKNLLLIALVQVLIKYALFEPFYIDTSLDAFTFSILMAATLFLAAAGNIINDIYDIETDTVNKPDRVVVGKSISEKVAYNLFFVFNIIGVALGFYISHHVGKSPFFALFVLVSASLYIYASYLKQLPFIGNLIISALVALSLIIVPIFDLLPAITPFNRATQITFFKILLDYAFFAFIINLIREMVKDMEDIDGDYKAGMNTIPIAIGRYRAGRIIFLLSIIPLFAVINYVLLYLYKQEVAVIYFLLFIVAPLIYISIKLFTAKTKKDYTHVSIVLKLVMLFGMLSMLLYPFILK